MLIYVFHNLRLESVDDIVFHITTYLVVFMLRHYLLIRYEIHVYFVCLMGYNRKGKTLFRNAYSRRVQIWVNIECEIFVYHVKIRRQMGISK